MSAKRMDLNKVCFFVINGVSNSLGKDLAVEMCRRFKPGSVALIIDDERRNIRMICEAIEDLDNDIKVICCHTAKYAYVDGKLFEKILSSVLSDEETEQFEFAFIIHNDGNFATNKLMEPQTKEYWLHHINYYIYNEIALNQAFIKCTQHLELPKLMVNINTSLCVQPLIFSSLLCSAKKARDMYFRSMAAEEADNGVIVMNYGPGIFNTHKPAYDHNHNIVDIDKFVDDPKILKLPRVEPLQSTLKLINILEKISFISGHDVDYYDTYNL